MGARWGPERTRREIGPRAPEVPDDGGHHEAISRPGQWPANLPPMPIDLQFALGFYLVFVISVTAHEAAHAWLAMRLLNTIYMQYDNPSIS